MPAAVLDQAVINQVDALAADLANGYQVEKDLVAAAMLATRTRIPGGRYAQIQQINQPLIHHVNHTDGVTQIVVFNENKQDFITNFSGGVVPPQTVFALRNVGIDIVPGLSRLGALSSNGDAFKNSTTPGPLLEIKRQAIETGFFQLKFQGKELFTMPLATLPIGAGLDVAAAHATTASSTSMSSAYATNGAPFAGNARPIGEGAHLLPGGGVLEGKLLFPAGVTFGVNAFWKIYLFGSSFFK